MEERDRTAKERGEGGQLRTQAQRADAQTGQVQTAAQAKGKKGKTARAASALAVLAAGCMWGSMGLWVRRFHASGLGSMQILAVRVVLTAFILSVVMPVLAWKRGRALLRVRAADLWCFLGTGIASIVFFGYCYNRAIVLTSLSVAAILLYTAPAIVSVLSFFLFGEALGTGKVVALLLAFAGCVLVSGVGTGSGSITAAGIWAGLGSGFGYALYSIFGRFALNKGYHPITVTWLTFLCALGAVLLLADWKELAAFWVQPGNVWYCLAYAMVTTVAPYLLYTWGLEGMESGRAAVMATVEPVVATLLGVLVMGERLTVGSSAGILLVLVSLVLTGTTGSAQTRSQKQKRE